MAAGETSHEKPPPSSSEAPSAPPFSDAQQPAYVPYTGYQQYGSGMQHQSQYEQQPRATSRPEYWQAEAPPQPGYYVTGPGGNNYYPLSGEYGYDRPLPCCGCGIGWCLFIFGFFFNLLWYVGAILWFFPHNPRERPGLTASLVAACISAAFALGIVAYFVSDRDNIMALWSSYQLGQAVGDS